MVNKNSRMGNLVGNGVSVPFTKSVQGYRESLDGGKIMGVCKCKHVFTGLPVWQSQSESGWDLFVLFIYLFFFPCR